MKAQEAAEAWAASIPQPHEYDVDFVSREEAFEAGAAWAEAQYAGRIAERESLGQNWHDAEARAEVEIRLGQCAHCGAGVMEHPPRGWVRFEWAETARPGGHWYYRSADLQSESVLYRDHSFVAGEQIAGPSSDERLNEIRWIGQADQWGCGFACLAMMLGRTYDEMVGELKARAYDKGIDYNDMDERLIDAGYALQRRYHIRWTEHGAAGQKRVTYNDPWPPQPWAPLHYANVQVSESSSSSHYVVIDATGKVYDPLTQDERHLADYFKVNNVTGVWRAEAAEAQLAETVRERDALALELSSVRMTVEQYRHGLEEVHDHALDVQ